MTGQHLTTARQNNSSEKPFLTERNVVGAGDILQKLASDKKKNSASGKLINKIGGNRTPSNPKRTEESLEKEDQRAKQMNVQFMNNVMKNQIAPNFINKLKMKKMQNVVQKKKTSKTAKLLNLIVPIKSEDEKNNY